MAKEHTKDKEKQKKVDKIKTIKESKSEKKIYCNMPKKKNQ